MIKRLGKVPIYVSRPVLNPEDVRIWAESAGFENVIAGSDMHVTVTYSKTAIEASDIVLDEDTCHAGIVNGVPRKIHSALGLELDAPCVSLSHQRHLEQGASFDYGDKIFRPHMTIVYDPTQRDLELSKLVKPFRRHIKLGPERAQELRTGWRPEI